MLNFHQVKKLSYYQNNQQINMMEIIKRMEKEIEPALKN
jgi:hypothetical protein